MISGIQKMTLLDFPGKVACTVFLHYCNYRCPFCHNSELLEGKPQPLMTEEEFFKFLSTRQGLLDGVCVSGGEPTLTPNLEDFLKKIKDMGFAVKLDTNGSNPQLLKHLVEAGLVDYVAMDVKNSPARYPETVGIALKNMEALEESLRFLIDGTLPYELRTTLVAQLHDADSITEMGVWLSSLVPGKRPEKFSLQSFVDRDTVKFAGLSAPAEDMVTQYADILSQYVGEVTIKNK